MSPRMPHRPAVTMRTHEVFAIAHDLADRFGHADVTPSHVLLAMLREGRSPAIVVLYLLGVPLDELERELESELSVSSLAQLPANEHSWSESDEEMLQRAGIESHGTLRKAGMPRPTSPACGCWSGQHGIAGMPASGHTHAATGPEQRIPKVSSSRTTRAMRCMVPAIVALALHVAKSTGSHSVGERKGAAASIVSLQPARPFHTRRSIELRSAC